MSKTVKCSISGYSPNSYKCRCTHCRDERARWQREYRKTKPDLLRAMNLRKYGLTLADYQQKFEEQDGVCAVCYQPENDSNQHSQMSLSVDHDHDTGQVRGLLCHRCNRALGLLNDSSSLVESLLNYRRIYE